MLERIVEEFFNIFQLVRKKKKQMIEITVINQRVSLADYKSNRREGEHAKFRKVEPSKYCGQTLKGLDILKNDLSALNNSRI